MSSELLRKIQKHNTEETANSLFNYHFVPTLLKMGTLNNEKQISIKVEGCRMRNPRDLFAGQLWGNLGRSLSVCLWLFLLLVKLPFRRGSSAWDSHCYRDGVSESLDRIRQRQETELILLTYQALQGKLCILYVVCYVLFSTTELNLNETLCILQI